MRHVLKPTLVLALLAVFLFWADSVGFRHGMVMSQQACGVNQILSFPRDVDFVVIGSSRTRQGIDPDLLRDASDGLIRTPMNFSRSGKGAARHFTLLKDLLEEGARPKTVLLELDIGSLMSDTDPSSIPVQRDAGFQSFHTIFQSFYIHPQRPLIERAQNVALKSLIKLRASLVYAASGDAFKHQFQAFKSDGAASVCRPKYVRRRPIHIQRYEESIKQFDEIFGPSRATMTDDRFSVGDTLQAQIELFYLNKVRSLASQYGVQLLVTRLWRAGQPPLSDQALSRIRAIIPEFIYPPSELVRGSWENFLDATHLNPKGGEDYTRWLASAVVLGVAH